MLVSNEPPYSPPLTSDSPSDSATSHDHEGISGVLQQDPLLVSSNTVDSTLIGSPEGLDSVENVLPSENTMVENVASEGASNPVSDDPLVHNFLESIATSIQPPLTHGIPQTPATQTD